MNLEDIAVGWGAVSDTDFDDVPRDKIPDGEGGERAGAEASGRLGLDFAEGSDGGGGIGLCRHSDGGIGGKDEDDDEGIDECCDACVAIDEGDAQVDCCCCEEDFDEEVIELFEDEGKKRWLRVLRELVGAVFNQGRGCLLL